MKQAGRIIPVVGGQFGSEGKGAVVTFLTRKLADIAERTGSLYPLVVRIGGPNAGHTGYDEAGDKWVTRTIPIAAIDSRALIAIAQGSEIDTTVLHAELEAMAQFGVADRIWIDPQATLLDETHKTWEKSHQMHERLGSTGKGIGAARASRIMRDAHIWRDAANASGLADRMANVSELCRSHLDAGGDVIIETSQGFGLGLHAGFYPFCTSTDCTATDALAAVGLPVLPYRIEPWVVLRTYPIRVAGNSGPLFQETTWEELGAMTHGHIKPETTTVTKKVRRVGKWDPELARRAVLANGGEGCSVALTFLDYLHPGSYGEDTLQKLSVAEIHMLRATASQIGARIRMVTTGPATAIAIPDKAFEGAPIQATSDLVRATTWAS